MGHHIEAIITSEKPNKTKIEVLDLPVFFENGFNIIPLDVCHTTYWGKKWNVYDENGDCFGGVNLLCLRSIERIAKEIEISNFALIATDYNGGIGEQAAIVYKDKREIRINGNYYSHYSGMDVVDINSDLRNIGVTKTKKSDEFDSINLSSYRSFDKYFEKYEVACEDE
ncbi:hypothetical protein [Olleya sp.]|jgi:hypothetical protein|uniref:hypothetical protein n=1 Tax=Olleya sp. TaxID=1906788 RepID=UPI0032D91061